MISVVEWNGLEFGVSEIDGESFDENCFVRKLYLRGIMLMMLKMYG